MQANSFAEGEGVAGYKLLSSMESGPGAWSTYLAEDSNGARVYLRLLPLHQVPSEKQAEFEAQNRKLSHLNHPNIAKIVRTGKTEMDFFLISEWIGSDTLKTRMDPASGEIELVQLLLIVRQMIQALSFALRYGITHGQLSSSLIFFDHHGRIKVDGLIGNSDINQVPADRQMLAGLLQNYVNESTRPEIYQRITKLIRFMTNPELEKTPIGYQKILEQIAPIISMCDGLKRFYDVSLFCPYCRDPLATGKLVRCEVCFTAQHESCWKEAKKCSVYNCEGKDIARIWTKEKIASYSLLFAGITLAALAGWGLYFYEKVPHQAPVKRKQIVANKITQVKPVNTKPKPSKPRQPLNRLGPKVEQTPQPAPVPQQVQIDPPVASPPQANPITISQPKRQPVILNLQEPVISFPKPGDRLYVGSSYEIKWLNSVPEKYFNNPNIVWSFSIYNVNGHFSKSLQFPPNTSSFLLTITDDFVISDNYRLSLCLAIPNSNPNFELLTPVNNCCEFAGKFSVSLRGFPF